jgi:hypothetical protein
MYGYTLDKVDGLLIRRAAGQTIRFAAGRMNVHVQYTAGYAVVPAELKLAGLLLLQHLWATQRGGARRPGLGGDDSGGPSDYDAFPSRVEEILANYYTPGIA